MASLDELLLYLLLLLNILHHATASPSPSPSPCPNGFRPYSAWMADSVVVRGQAIAHPGTEKDSSIFLQIGFFQTAVLRLLDHYGSAPCAHEDWDVYMTESTQSIVPRLVNVTQDTLFPLDRLSIGRGILSEYKKTDNATYRIVLDALRRSIDLQPRNSLGGLWYFTYPNWSYLDGMYSFAPFLSMYTTHFNPSDITTVTNEIIHQLDLLWYHCLYQNSTLLVHGYDASKEAVWANHLTGASPMVWDRSLGWYLMALVDTLELLSPNSTSVVQRKQWDHLRQRFIQLADTVVAAADPHTGCWWQVMSFPGREGNYIESSGSAMFTYALYKGARLGYFPRAGYAKYVADKCYNYLVERFVVENDNGTLAYNGTVAVCSLNSTATYEYYIRQPILYNSVHGSAAFVLASLEHEIAHA